MKYIYALIASIPGMLVYMAIGGGVHLAFYGEPTSITLKLAVLLLAWPFALIWWSLWYIFLGMFGLFAIGIIVSGVLVFAHWMGWSWGMQWK